MPRPADLEDALRFRLRSGGRLFLPYITGGLPGVDADLLRGLEAAGADALEVGIPFSDPIMDGPVIQEASRRALEGGATTRRVLEVVADARLGVPVVAMTYANTVWNGGHERFVDACVEAGIAGVIVPDLPVDEAGGWIAACASVGVAPVLLAAPGASETRLRAVAGAARGFVYCVTTYGVTGERERLAQTAEDLVARLRPLTDRPLVVGVGIGEPSQAARACAFADGVVVGSALVRRLLEGDAAGMLELAGAFRAAVTAS